MYIYLGDFEDDMTASLPAGGEKSKSEGKKGVTEIKNLWTQLQHKVFGKKKKAKKKVHT